MSIQDKIDRLIVPGQRQSPLSVAIGYRDKLDKIGPRKLLACDGGGIRGIISIEILARIESELRKSSGNPNVVLADYFDYVAGTSTGASIATLDRARASSLKIQLHRMFSQE